MTSWLAALIRVTVVLAGILLNATAAQAEPVTFRFSGSGSTFFTDPMGLLPGVTASSSFNGTVTFDSSAPDINPDPGFGTYFHTPTPGLLTLNIGNVTFLSGQVFPYVASVQNNTCNGLVRDCFRAAANFQQAIVNGTTYPPLGAPSGDPSTAGVARTLDLLLEGPPDTFETDALPTTLDVNAFTTAQIQFRAGDPRLGPIAEGRFTISSIQPTDPAAPVPEPMSALLVGTGLLLTACRYRRSTRLISARSADTPAPAPCRPRP